MNPARGVAPVGETPTLFPVRGFNTHTFSAVFLQFCTNALQHALRFSGRSVSALAAAASSQTWHRLWVWPADDWLFCLKSRLSLWFIGQLVLRRRDLRLWLFYISLFQVLWMSVFSQQSFDLCSECVFTRFSSITHLNGKLFISCMLYLLYPSVIVFIVFIVNKQTTSIPRTFEKLATPLNPACSASLCVNGWMAETRIFFFFTTYTEARVTLAVISASTVSIRT